MRKIFLCLIGCMLLFSMHFTYAATPKKWTFLIFMNGDNGLDPETTKNLIDMEKVGSNEDVNIVVQWASLSAKKSVRLLVEKSTDPSKVTSPILQDLGSVDMGDYHSLQDFINWGVKNFPAQHYFIAIWDHGSGWHSNQNTLNDISWDENTNNWITTEQLGATMAYAASVIGHNVDIYGSDACQMGMVEVANQMSNSVDYFIGSEYVEPDDSWPYSKLLSQWEAIPDSTPDQISKILTDEYVKAYQGSGLDVTLSAFRMDKLDAFDQAFKKLSDEIRTLPASEKTKVLDAIENSQTFFEQDYRDDGEFLTNLKQENITEIPVDDINQVLNTLHDFVIANADSSRFINAEGVSIWSPITYRGYNQNADRYSHLNFNQATQWNDTLNFLLQGTE